MSSPPVPSQRVCANGYRRQRLVRARRLPVGFLVLATSLPLAVVALLATPRASEAQFPIRQIPRSTAPPRERPAAPATGVSQGGLGGQSAAATEGSPKLPAVARIVVPEKGGVSYGSGTLVDARGQFGLVISNWHVVRDAAGPILVEFPDGYKTVAEVVRTDKDWDLAALSIGRPPVAPMPVSAVAPQPGDWLTIAGYGSGAWRAVSGRCTQYLAPGIEFPHEMVELSAEARQGDSGGPILNQRGELAGVLFGSGPGYTSGSYGGRVLKFLAPIVPGGTPGGDAAGLAAAAPAATAPFGAGAASPPTAASPPPPATGYAYQPPAPPPTSPVITPPPQATALHEDNPSPPQRSPSKIASSDASEPTHRVVDDTVMTPALKPTPDPLLSPPPRGEMADRFGPRPLAETRTEVDPRVAVAPSRIDHRPSPVAPAALRPLDGPPDLPSGIHSEPLAPRVGPPATLPVHDAPPSDLLLAVWRKFGGVTFFDQAKSVLAIVGALTVAVIAWRLGGEKEHGHDEE